MRVEVYDEQGMAMGELNLDPGQTPARTQTSLSHEFIPDWERAHDDEGNLRRCIACGCDHLYRHRTLPRVTGFVIVLALAVAAASVLGLASGWPMLVGMTALLIIDVAILLWRNEVLICYRCQTRYWDLTIARYHNAWNRRTAHRMRRGEQRFDVNSSDSA